MACIKKFFLKDRGSWTPAVVQHKSTRFDERSRRYTLVDFENFGQGYLEASNGAVRTLKLANGRALPVEQLKLKPKAPTRKPDTHKRPAPKPPKGDSKKTIEIAVESSCNEILSAITVEEKSPPRPHLKKTLLNQIQSPTYLEELKEKQVVLREKKSKTELSPEKHTGNYEELKFTIGKSTRSDKPTKVGSKLPKSHNKQSLHDMGHGKGSKASKQMERDSGVHVEEADLGNDDDLENDSSVREYDDLNPPAHSKGRKEGLIFTRPKLSNEREKVIKVFEKDKKARDLIRGAIEANDFLNNYMDNERKELVIDAMEPAVYEKDSFIIRENEEGSEIYVSDEGVFDVIKNNEIINTFGMGIVFGELAILYNAKRFASIKASSKAKVWKIDRTNFRTIMVISGSKEREENLNFLRSVPLLKDLPQEILLRVVDLLKRVFFPTNTCIVKQGHVGNDFFIIRGGSVTIKKNTDDSGEKVVARRKRGDYFGEQALLNEDRRTASVYADPPGTECLKLDRVSFISFLGTIPELKERPIDRIEFARERRASSIVSNMYSHIQLDELDRIATLGIGGFGRVDLVSYKGTQTFALKVLRKIDIIKQEQIDHVYSEKMVMQMCHSPFIVELYATFRDNKCVYFLMEACLGGDVWTIMHQRQFFDEKTARFIVACVVEAFEFLHARNIIYRDLKPENLMLTPDGYCKLVDFGFAKRIAHNSKTNTFAGTPEYVAPEIILDRGHDRAVDYWELGILVHELLSGRPPFRGRDQMKIYQQILGGIEAIQMSTRIPKSAQNMIKNLCKQMPAERLGYQKRGIADIKKHSWFDGFDWNKLQSKALPAPIKRPIRSNTDLRYFTPNQETIDTPPDELSGWDRDF